MDDLIWVDPKPSGAVGGTWHNASTVPVPGYVAYIRLDIAANPDKEKQKR